MSLEGWKRRAVMAYRKYPRLMKLSRSELADLFVRSALGNGKLVANACSALLKLSDEQRQMIINGMEKE